MRLRFGIEVSCEDAVVGHVADVVVDPVARRLTHVVLMTEEEVVRLVPVQHFDDGGRKLALTCPIAQVSEFESIRRLAYLGFSEEPEHDDGHKIGIEEMVAVPYFEEAQFGDYVGEIDPNVTLTYDVIPEGGAELRGASDVISADGHSLGRAAGFDVDGGRLTHLVLEHGHLWWTRDVSVPIDDVEQIGNDRVTLTRTKDEVSALPSLRVGRSAR
jgi:sporulation protein YlmC with PRC-barrel domain